ncbi:hypothetical protein KY306_02430 [Candidatus Woesearchaeota archaeon]|nr:hypothetical protein [Candidatus Woesearchaeota archaeon]
MAKKKSKIRCKPSFNSSCGGGFYFLGIIGSAVYFISNSTGFWGVILALLKALVWPAFLIYYLLKFLGM